jgi:WD40 repeat protein
MSRKPSDFAQNYAERAFKKLNQSISDNELRVIYQEILDKRLSIPDGEDSLFLLIKMDYDARLKNLSQPGRPSAEDYERRLEQHVTNLNAFELSDIPGWLIFDEYLYFKKLIPDEYKTPEEACEAYRKRFDGPNFQEFVELLNDHFAPMPSHSKPGWLPLWGIARRFLQNHRLLKMTCILALLSISLVLLIILFYLKRDEPTDPVNTTETVKKPAKTERASERLKNSDDRILQVKPLPGLVPYPAPELGRWQFATPQSLAGWKRVAWSPNGKLLALACRDGYVRVNRADNGDLEDIFVGHTNEVECVAWSPNSRFLASGSKDKTVRVWDISHETPPRVFTVPQPIHCLAWDRSNHRLVSGGLGDLNLWDISKGKLISGNMLPAVDVSAVSWNPKNDEIAVVSQSGSLLIRTIEFTDEKWEVKSFVCPDATKKLFCVAWSPDGSMIAAGGEGQLVPLKSDLLAPGGKSEVHLWDARNGKLIRTLEASKDVADGFPNGFGLAIQSVAWDKDSRRLAIGAQGGPLGYNSISIFDVETGERKWRSTTYQPVFSLFWSPDGQRLLSGHGDGSYHFRNADNGNKEKRPETWISSIGDLTLDMEKNLFAVGTRDGKIRLGDLSLSGKSVKIIEGLPTEIYRIVWNHASNRLAVLGWNNEIHIRVVNSQPAHEKTVVLNTSQKKIFDIDWKADGTQMVSVGENGLVQIWNANGTSAQGPDEQLNNALNNAKWPDGKKRELRDTIRAVAWSPNGDKIAFGIGWNPGIIYIWDIKTGIIDELPHKHKGGVLRLRWAFDNYRLVSCDDDSKVLLWDLRLPIRQMELQRNRLEGYGWAIAWSPDDTRFAVGDQTGNCRIWKADGTLDKEFKASFRPLRSVAWKSDGTLITGGDDGIIRFWNAEEGKQDRFLLINLTDKLAVAITARGQLLEHSLNTDKDLLFLREDGHGYMERLSLSEYERHWKTSMADKK